MSSNQPGTMNMDNPIHIRRAVGEDADTIIDFNTRMALESEDVALDQRVLQAGVAAALADPLKAFYLLAENDGAAVGQLMVTTEWSDWRNGWVWWVQSVYVMPDHRRQGVYRSLYSKLQQMADESGDVRGMRLYVMRENMVAKRTYEALGMSHSEYDLYESEF
jgi:GNAT superfamily N-acetyltransferase